jgi:hypothetical protein
MPNNGKKWFSKTNSLFTYFIHIIPLTRDYRSICEQIQQLAKIRFAGVINERGRLVEGGTKNGLTTFSSAKEDEMLFMELVLRVKMRQEFDTQLGRVKFAMALREKVLEMSFPLDKHVLFVVSESDVDYGVLPKEIIKIIG